MRRIAGLVLAGAATVAFALATVAAPASGSTAAAATTGRSITISPGADLTAQLTALRPGDTLYLRPGTYVAHTVRPVLTRGTATAKIVVRAADPTNLPLIQGNLRLWGPSYWVLDALRIQAIDPGTDALDIFGGHSWTVVNSEIFGTLNTGGYANVNIATDTTTGTGSPSGFLFQSNCVHTAGRSGRTDHTDHNIYVNFAGSASSGGWINRNVIFDHVNGAGIKLGNGGSASALGPWNVTVTHNTIAQGGRQILLSGNVRNNVISGNTLAWSMQAFNASPKTTLVYVNQVGNSTNVVAHNYGYGASMFSYGGSVNLSGDDALRPNPTFASLLSCTGYVPTYANAMPYGRWGTGPWPVW